MNTTNTTNTAEYVMPLTSFIIRMEARLARTGQPVLAPTRDVLLEVRAGDLNACHLGKVVYLDGGTRGRLTRIERRPDSAMAGGYVVDLVVKGEDSIRTYPGSSIVRFFEMTDIPIQEGLASAEGWAENLAFRRAEEHLLCSLGRIEGEQILARMRGFSEEADGLSIEDGLRVAAADGLIVYQAELRGFGVPTEKIAVASRRISIEMQAAIANVISADGQGSSRL
jgi:hypothetical protein